MNNRPFSISVPLTEETARQFISEGTEFLKKVMDMLKKHCDILEAYLKSSYDVTHSYHRLATSFEPEDPDSPLGQLIDAVSCVGRMGSSLYEPLKNHKTELDSLFRRVCDMHARFVACEKLVKPRQFTEEAKNIITLLRLDFNSEIIDQCMRMLNADSKLGTEQARAIAPLVSGKIDPWCERCCHIQRGSFSMRSTQKMTVDSAISRGCTTPVFGTSLQSATLVPGYGIPQIVFDTTEALLTTPGALESEGLFRISASKSALERLKGEYNAGHYVSLTDEDPNVIAGLLKLWLRELPEPLIPQKMSVRFSSEKSGGIVAMKRLVYELPRLNRLCLHRIMEVAYNTSLKKDVNKMDAGNLAIVFGAVVSRRDDVDIQNPAVMAQVSSMTVIVGLFIEHYNTIFGPFKGWNTPPL